MRARSLVVPMLVLGTALSGAGAAEAQGLSRTLIDLLAKGIVSQRGTNTRVLPPGVDPNHEGHFLIAESSPLLFLNAALFNQAVATQLASFPLGSASGGFTYSFDPETATFSRTSDSFGPSFTERSVTQGHKKFSWGVNYQRATYDSFEGKSLEDGELRFYLEHNNCCPGGSDRSQSTAQTSPSHTPFFEGDVVESALSIRLSTDTTLLFFNYGLADRVDVGVVVPFQHVDLQATNNATILRLSTAEFPEVHLFDGPDPTRASFSAGGSKTGIGDIAVRSKWNFLRTDSGGLAGALELRLPTGDEENLLGSGATQGKASLIGSFYSGKFAGHANVAYRISGSGLNRQLEISDTDRQTRQSVMRVIDLDAQPESAAIDLNPNEFSYAAALEWSAGPRITLSGEVYGRLLVDAGRLVETPSEFRFRPGSNVAPLSTTTFLEPDLNPDNLHQSFAAVGLKLNLTSTLLLSANVSFALTSSGLRDDVAPLVGIDYVF